MDVLTAEITAKGDNMNASTSQTETAGASVAGKPKATKRAGAAKRGAHVAHKKGGRGRNATFAKKAPKPPNGEKRGEPARVGSKAAKVLELLQRPGGVTAKELQKVTGWQPHSVRGFLSGTIRKKLGLTLTSARSGDGGSTYSIEA
jgi:hypothetical protein